MKSSNFVEDGEDQLDNDRRATLMSHELGYSGKIEQLLNLLSSEDLREAEN